MDALLNCPFCGGAAIEDGERITCAECDLQQFTPDAWNRRASSPAPDGEVGRLVELLGEWIERRRSIGCHSDAGLFGDVRDCLLAQSAALTAQAAALEEAERELDRIAARVIAARDAHIAKNYAKAWHQLYGAADPDFERLDPWHAFTERAERHATISAPAKGEEET